MEFWTMSKTPKLKTAAQFSATPLPYIDKEHKNCVLQNLVSENRRFPQAQQHPGPHSGLSCGL